MTNCSFWIGPVTAHDLVCIGIGFFARSGMALILILGLGLVAFALLSKR